jgi:hypothetical protein
MHLDADIELNREMNLDVVIEGVWRYHSRLRSINSEMHLAGVIERVWRCTWRP